MTRHLDTIPHADILQMPMAKLKNMPVEQKMLKMYEVGNATCDLKLAWKKQGWAEHSMPANERSKFQVLEDIGVKILQSVEFPEQYHQDGHRELDRAFEIINNDPLILEASQNYRQFSPSQRCIILQHAVNILAYEQDKLAPIPILPGTVRLTSEDGEWQGCIDAPYHRAPRHYLILVNTQNGSDDLITDIGVVLHEQRHIKQQTLAHFTRRREIPKDSPYHKAGEYFYQVDSLDAKFNYLVSDRFYQNDPCEQDAFVVNDRENEILPMAKQEFIPSPF